MTSARWRRWLAIAAIGAALTACGAPAAPAPTPPAPPSSAAAPSSAAQAATADGPLPHARPVRLEVPAIGVSTGPIVDLGLAGDGALEVPEDAVTTGWFTGSPSPGETGPAVLAAHVDYNHVPGTFNRLKDTKPGDQAIVHRADGTTAVFTVYRVERYPKSAFPTDDVYGDTAGPELRMITCGGAFDRSTHNYEDNIVAYARLSQAYRG
ncbi:class F sortase [Amycolatopsis viridis]|uniref:Sortase (Surface protein transpeptidase) n=1 Tax=Amycolatopsis viridis TaxID=185678 RepID=A0ABX0STN7_9PSEU|nr:class F sortase [Amycolatopsis viridis]NIH78880.1 sortase (surface protein transpeptidase) [Amycolatopsis viridis]